MSQRQSEYDRVENEAYFTPAWVVDCLFEAFPELDDYIGFYDPACGDGQICRAIQKRGRYAGGSDLNCYGYTHEDDNQDFLEMMKLPAGFGGIITNPPYGAGGRLAVKFIEHALDLTKPVGGAVAMLLRSDFDFARGRRHLFSDHSAYAAQVTLLKRIQWTNLIHTASPSQNHAWFIWSHARASSDLPVKIYVHPDDEGVAA